MGFGVGRCWVEGRILKVIWIAGFRIVRWGMIPMRERGSSKTLYFCCSCDSVIRASERPRTSNLSTRKIENATRST